jgi:hypothetical protein
MLQNSRCNDFENITHMEKKCYRRLIPSVRKKKALLSNIKKKRHLIITTSQGFTARQVLVTLAQISRPRSVKPKEKNSALNKIA